MVAQAEDRSKEFLADTDASHHICHKREYFMDLQPLSGPLNKEQVQGTVGVTHAGTVILEVDAKEGKIALRLKKNLFIESMQYNILSMQQLYTSDFIPVYKEVADKVVLKKILQNGDQE